MGNGVGNGSLRALIDIVTIDGYRAGPQTSYREMFWVPAVVKIYIQDGVLLCTQVRRTAA